MAAVCGCGAKHRFARYQSPPPPHIRINHTQCHFRLGHVRRVSTHSFDCNAQIDTSFRTTSATCMCFNRSVEGVCVGVRERERERERQGNEFEWQKYFSSSITCIIWSFWSVINYLCASGNCKISLPSSLTGTWNGRRVLRRRCCRPRRQPTHATHSNALSSDVINVNFIEFIRC